MQQIGEPDSPLEELDAQFSLEGDCSTRMRLLWTRRRILYRFALAGLILGTMVALLIPNRYESIAQLMPPDSQSPSSLALMAGLTGTSNNGLGMLAGDLLGVKGTGALFVGSTSKSHCARSHY